MDREELLKELLEKAELYTSDDGKECVDIPRELYEKIKEFLS